MKARNQLNDMQRIAFNDGLDLAADFLVEMALKFPNDEDGFTVIAKSIRELKISRKEMTDYQNED